MNMPEVGKIIQAGCQILNINPSKIKIAVAVNKIIPETLSKKLVECCGDLIPNSLS